MNAKSDLTRFVRNIRRLFNRAVSEREMREVGGEAIRIITKRTRLGFGVNRPEGQRSRLKGLADATIRNRIRNKKQLSKFTKPNRSNLTFTGQMLQSMNIKSIRRASVQVGPDGIRDDGLSNAFIAEIHQTGRGLPKRSFLYLSAPEVRQLIRFYRRNFGDLVKRV